jgi:hypothetical protein
MRLSWLFTTIALLCFALASYQWLGTTVPVQCLSIVRQEIDLGSLAIEGEHDFFSVCVQNSGNRTLSVVGIDGDLC